MHHRENSPVHSSLLCGNLRVRTRSVNRSPMTQSLAPRGFGDRVCTLPTSSFTVSMVAPERDPQPFSSMNPMASRYYADTTLMYTPTPPEFSGYYPIDNSGFVANAYDPYVSAYPPVDSPLDFGGSYSEPVPAYQPPTPPPAPVQSPLPDPGFLYYPCRWMSGHPCDGLAPGRNREMGEHLRASHHFVGHERDQVQCQWEDCGQLMQRMNVPRHIVSRHLLAAAHCRFCGKQFSRPDVVARHERRCGVSPISSGPAARV